MYKILTEASGSLTSAYLIKAIKESGQIAVASDIDPECAGRYLADEFILMPDKDDPNLWEYIKEKVISHNVQIVIPSFDETLLGWAERKNEFRELGVYVLVSDEDIIRIFQDKWLTYQYFTSLCIPTPDTSLAQKYKLLKPRLGRGSKGIKLTTEPTAMEGMISQEFLAGEEYTIDIFCDNNSRPIYIIPRKRLKINDGKSIEGVTVRHDEIIKWCKRICENTSFVGPINIQCFDCGGGNIKFVEINPRIAGGMALGFAASENWVRLIIENFIKYRDVVPKPVKYGLKMKRYYAEIFIS